MWHLLRWPFSIWLRPENWTGAKIKQSTLQFGAVRERFECGITLYSSNLEISVTSQSKTWVNWYVSVKGVIPELTVVELSWSAQFHHTCIKIVTCRALCNRYPVKYDPLSIWCDPGLSRMPFVLLLSPYFITPLPSWIFQCICLERCAFRVIFL